MAVNVVLEGVHVKLQNGAGAINVFLEGVKVEDRAFDVEWGCHPRAGAWGRKGTVSRNDFLWTLVVRRDKYIFA